MSEQVITTKRGTYGRVQVTLPMPVKQTMLNWVSRSGMRKSEFLRMALMIGAAQIANNVGAKSPDEGYFKNSSTFIMKQ